MRRAKTTPRATDRLTVTHARTFAATWTRTWFGILCALAPVLVASGCSSTATVSILDAAVNTALKTAGLKPRSASDGKVPAYEVSLAIAAGEQLNLTGDGQPLSLVIQIYQLRNPQSFKTLTYAQASSPDGGKATLGDDLISLRAITAVPGETYRITQKMPGDGTTIGIVGLFLSPADNRWKIAFNASKSRDAGITVGAHACALTAGKGVLDPAVSMEAVRTLSGVQCNG
jgi:type VI secretion system protein VasD